MSDVTTARRQFGSLSLNYAEAGTGPTLILLHGAFQTWRCWRRVIERLASDFHLLAPDLRGIGDSDRPAEGYEMFSAAEDIAALVRAMAPDGAFVAGHDIGGGVGAALALAEPQLVRAFAFLDMALPGFGFEDIWVPRPDGHFLWFGALNSVPGAIETLLAGRERDYISFVLRAVSANPEAFDATDVDAYAEAYARPGGLAALSAYFQAMWRNADAFKARASEARYQGPVLAVGGEHSTGLLAGESMRGVADRVQSEIVAGAGHWMPEEKPDETAALLKTFFTEQVPRT
jgi:pimeloyl-ACP methyl ester carboxylesterase